MQGVAVHICKAWLCIYCIIYFTQSKWLIAVTAVRADVCVFVHVRVSMSSPSIPFWLYHHPYCRWTPRAQRIRSGEKAKTRHGIQVLTFVNSLRLLTAPARSTHTSSLRCSIIRVWLARDFWGRQKQRGIEFEGCKRIPLKHGCPLLPWHSKYMPHHKAPLLIRLRARISIL